MELGDVTAEQVESELESFLKKYTDLLANKDAMYFLTALKVIQSQKSSGLGKTLAPISKRKFYDGDVEEAISESFVAARRKTKEGVKQFFEDKEKNQDKISKDYYSSKLRGNYVQLDNIDYSTMKFPTSEIAEKDFIKCSLETINEQELEGIIGGIKQTTDTNNHRFPIKVNGAYRVKNLNKLEKEFQKINQDRDNTSFYYHGTSYKSSQKILGSSGKFKVFRAEKDISTGRMLGDGIYLANMASKAAQYSSASFARHGQGVLFICEASLGKVVHTKEKDTQISRRIWSNNEGNMDTMYIPKPHVDNDEWCVKDAEGVIPRILIDINKNRD